MYGGWHCKYTVLLFLIVINPQREKGRGHFNHLYHCLNMNSRGYYVSPVPNTHHHLYKVSPMKNMLWNIKTFFISCFYLTITFFVTFYYTLLHSLTDSSLHVIANSPRSADERIVSCCAVFTALPWETSANSRWSYFPCCTMSAVGDFSDSCFKVFLYSSHFNPTLQSPCSVSSVVTFISGWCVVKDLTNRYLCHDNFQGYGWSKSSILPFKTFSFLL